MFKAKLIEDNTYYQLKSQQLLLMLLPAIPFGILVNYFKYPIWLTIFLIGVYILALVLITRNQKKIKSIVGKRQIEINEKQIQIKSREGNNTQKIIELDHIKKILVLKSYGIPQDTMKDISKEISGKQRKNYIIIDKEDKQYRFDFEIDSYYMVNQLEKIISNWLARGYPIERI